MRFAMLVRRAIRPATAVCGIFASHEYGSQHVQCETSHTREMGNFKRPSYSYVQVQCEGSLKPLWKPSWLFDLEYRMELGRELGHGGYGQVFLAVHKTGISRAVKRVKRSDREADAALQKEFEILQRLQGCRHIVKVIDGFVDDTYRYMVMEICFGLDLVDSIVEELSIDDHGIPDIHPNIPHVAAVFREMVNAIAECHEVLPRPIISQTGQTGGLILMSPAAVAIRPVSSATLVHPLIPLLGGSHCLPHDFFVFTCPSAIRAPFLNMQEVNLISYCA